VERPAAASLGETSLGGQSFPGRTRMLTSTRRMTASEIREKIEATIAGAVAEVRDYTGTGDHFEVRVVADAFEGKPLVERHQMVYAALGAAVDGHTIHALALKTLTPAQAGRSS
jgi:stress-induced morphogen